MLDPRLELEPDEQAAEVAQFLEGPQGRGFELRHAFRVFREYVRGLRSLYFVGPCVTVFGSSRLTEESEYYAMGQAVGAKLVKEGFTVMTGGGPGLMEAANRGAKEAGGRSIGCGINLDAFEPPNRYLDRLVEFNYFFVRKVMLVKYSYGFVILPGGFGTLDEVCEVATLVETGKIHDFPIVLMGKEFWTPYLDFLRGTMVSHGTIAEHELGYFTLLDDPEEAAVHIRRAAMHKFGLRWAKRRRRRWWLGE